MVGEVRRLSIKLSPVHPLTDAELAALSERNPGYQLERNAKGELVVAPTSSEGGRRSGEAFRQLAEWNRRARLGVVFDASTGFNLPDGSCLSPDAAWIQRARWDALAAQEREGFAPICPDAVFEVRSRSNTRAELRDKARAYIANGARLAVVIDVEADVVEVYRPGAPEQLHAHQATLALAPELPGFSLDLASIRTA
jgi:Uma2 family endonuclease